MLCERRVFISAYFNESFILSHEWNRKASAICVVKAWTNCSNRLDELHMIASFIVSLMITHSVRAFYVEISNGINMKYIFIENLSPELYYNAYINNVQY
uniref:Uncharacterized protein n=1 Tax=Glossina pallidipes TaxID=7398 RepID=A0A1A9ZC72_GLOPL